MRVPERILLFINQFFPKKKVQGRESTAAYSDAQYAWARKSLALHAPYVDLKGKVMLDAGCGPGGKTVYFSEQGVKSITGVDIDPDRIELAKAYAASKNASLPQFMVGNLAALPFESDHFDVIFLNDVVEHIERPILVAALKECKRVLKPRGRICIEFPPWTSYDAAHLYDYIHMPWCHVFFSDRTLMNVMKKLAPHKPEVGTLSYEAHYYELNKLTIGEFRSMVNELGFSIVHLDQLILFQQQFLKHIPILGKYLTRRVTAVLSK
jgi:ubiquinone/menaquinone biosynthesis C-methylase UbiE